MKFLPTMSVCFVNIIDFYATVIQVRCLALAIKPGLIHHFLHKKMTVKSQEYDSY